MEENDRKENRRSEICEPAHAELFSISIQFEIHSCFNSPRRYNTRESYPKRCGHHDGAGR